MKTNIKYFSRLSDSENKIIKLNELYEVSKKVEFDYPNHYEWFYNKFVKELDGIKREIIYYEINKKPVGVAFLKNTEEEKKICTIIVKEEYQKKGIGTLLLECSFEFLGTRQPLISMPEYKLGVFSKIIEKNNWQIFETIDSLYSNNKEFVFNGYLKMKDKIK